jgi:hypothetical protein
MAKYPYLYPPGTGWSGYIPGHWVTLSSSLMTLAVMVGVFEPACTQELTRKEVVVEINFRPMVSRAVYLRVGLPSGAHDNIFVFCLTVAGFSMWGVLSDQRMGL